MTPIFTPRAVSAPRRRPRRRCVTFALGVALAGLPAALAAQHPGAPTALPTREIAARAVVIRPNGERFARVNFLDGDSAIDLGHLVSSS